MKRAFGPLDVNGYAATPCRTFVQLLFGVHGIAVRQHVCLWPMLVFFGSEKPINFDFDQPFTATAAVMNQSVLGLGGRGPDKCQRFFGLPELKTFPKAGSPVDPASFYAADWSKTIKSCRWLKIRASV